MPPILLMKITLVIMWTYTQYVKTVTISMSVALH